MELPVGGNGDGSLPNLNLLVSIWLACLVRYVPYYVLYVATKRNTYYDTVHSNIPLGRKNFGSSIVYSPKLDCKSRVVLGYGQG